MSRKKLIGGAFASAAVVLGVLVGLICFLFAAGEAQGRLIHKENSLYHQIFVHREGSVVTLRFSKRHRIVQSRVDLKDPRRHMLEYSTLAFGATLYQPHPRRALVIGLGGGVIPREIRHYFPECRVDVVEIDPAIPKVARRFFGFETGKQLEVHVQDGRVFVRGKGRGEDKTSYDLIVLDAFNSDYIPFHLMTREFLSLVKDILQPDGIVVANVFSDNRLFDAEWRTFNAVFGRSQVFFGRSSSNAMIMAPGPRNQLLTEAEARDRAETLQERHGFSFDIRQTARRLRPEAEPKQGAPILTDDRAPVNKLRFQDR